MLFFKKHRKTKSAENTPTNTTTTSATTTRPIEDDPHDMSFLLTVALHSQDYGWETVEMRRKVYLLNHERLQNALLGGLAACLNGTNHYEWEVLLAAWICYAVDEAIEAGDEVADLTPIFSRDLTASRRRVLKREEVESLLLARLFEVVREEDEVLWVKLRS